MENNINSNVLSYNISDNSSINEKQRKLFLKINSLISSAENFETLKLYEDSLKIFKEALDLVKSLCKKPMVEENISIKNFFSFFDSNIKSKIRIIEQLIYVKNSFSNSNKMNKDMDLSNVPSQINNSSFTHKNSNQNQNMNLSNIDYSLSKEEILKIIIELLKNCEKNISEIRENRKNLNNSAMENTFINQISFYIPDVNQETYKNQGFKASFNFKSFSLI